MSKISLKKVEAFLQDQITALEYLLLSQNKKLEITLIHRDEARYDVYSLETVQSSLKKKTKIKQNEDGLKITFRHPSYPRIFIHIFNLLRDAPELQTTETAEKMVDLHSKLYRANDHMFISSDRCTLFIDRIGLEVLFDVKSNIKNQCAAQASNPYSHWAGAEKPLLASDEDEYEDQSSYRR